MMLYGILCIAIVGEAPSLPLTGHTPLRVWRTHTIRLPHPLSQPVRAASSPKGGAEGALRQVVSKSVFER